MKEFLICGVTAILKVLLLSFIAILLNAMAERSNFLEKIGFSQGEKTYPCPKIREICEVNKKLTLEDLPKLGDKN